MRRTTNFLFDDVHIPPVRQIGMHSQSTWELSLVVIGSGTRTVGGATETIEEGETILIPPAIPHCWHFDGTRTDANGDIANITVTFSGETLKKTGDIFPEIAEDIGRIMQLTNAVRYRGAALERIRRSMMSMRGLSPKARLPRIIELITMIADTESYYPIGDKSSLSSSERRLDALNVFCKCNFAKAATLDSAAAYMNVGKSSLCTFIKRHTGKTFTEYINDLRLEKAVELLAMTDENIASIAYDSGFTSVPYFNRRFRDKFGCTPTRYRSELQ